MKNNFLFAFVVIIGLLSFFNFASDGKNINLVKSCKDLNISDYKPININNFSQLELIIKFDNERKWKKNNIESFLEAKQLEKIGWGLHFASRKRVDAEITIIKNNLKCKVKAKIRPHGDLEDHRVGSGLPSLNINIENGNIFGITKFLLLRPHTRNHSNEIFINTLFSNLGLLAPRTSIAKVNYNGYESDFIFQEKIEKEFLEYNKLKEGPIFDGDERFLFIDKIDNLEFKKHKLSNDNWIKNSKEKEFISLIGFSKLNETQSTYNAKYTQFVVDYASLAKKKNNNMFDEVILFDSLSFGVLGEHGLSMNDRFFYYDHNYNKFKPILYDSGSTLLDKFGLINEFKLYPDDKLLEKSSLIYGKVSPSAVEGSKLAIALIKGINTKKLLEDLNNRGFKANDIKLNKILEKIKSNLEQISNFKNSRIFEVNVKLPEQILKEREDYNKKVEREFVFYDKYFKKLLNCKTENIENCEVLKQEKNSITKLLSQKLENKKKKLVFYAKDNATEISKVWFHQNVFSSEINKQIKNKEYIFENINFILYGDINYTVDKQNKILRFFKNSEYGSVLIFKSNLDNWKIIYENNSEIYNLQEGNDYNFLTGCLNIYDSTFYNNSIISKNCEREDGINIVRSNGIINYLEITNSKFDGVDFDFSEILINEAIIKNSKNDCLDLSYGSYKINSYKAQDCGDKGISLGENSLAKVNILNISNAEIGIAAKDDSVFEVEQFFGKNLASCLSAYNKKQEFGGGLIIVDKINCENYEKIELSDKNSKILIN